MKVEEAIRALGGQATNDAIVDWVLKRYPLTHPGTAAGTITVLTVNHPSRVGFPQNFKPRLATDDRYDLLYRDSPGHVVTYASERHGKWAIVSQEGKPHVKKLDSDEPLADELPAPETPDSEFAEESGLGEDVAQPTAAAAAEFALEKHLENFIVENFEQIFAGKLRLHRDEEGHPAQQYPTIDERGRQTGLIDILAIDTSSRDFVVVELKKGRESDKVVGQILRYIGWVRDNLCTEGQNARGLIICSIADQKLQAAVKPIESLVGVRLYKIDFQLVEPGSPAD